MVYSGGSQSVVPLLLFKRGAFSGPTPSAKSEISGLAPPSGHLRITAHGNPMSTLKLGSPWFQGTVRLRVQ